MSRLSDATRLRDAAAVKRWHVQRTLRQQTVGEHTFGMILLVRQCVHPDKPPDRLNELLLCIVHHDLPELDTGDIPAHVKIGSSELSDVLGRLEQDAHMLFHGTHKLSESELVLLKWADTMELVLWCMEEVRMGNRFMDHIVKRGLSYLDKIVPLPQAARELTQEVIAAALLAGIGEGLYEERSAP